MITPPRVLGLLTLALVFVGCPQALDPELTLTAKPRTIDNRGAKSVIAITAVDSAGKPGTGSVRVTSAAGSLKAGVEVMLDPDGGSANVDFSCDSVADQACVPGSVRINGEWVSAGKLAEALATVTLTLFDAGRPDAGIDAGVDAGFDAGVDAGNGGGTQLDGGRTDGGFFGLKLLTASADKVVLLEGTSDVTQITATLTTNTTQPQPVVNQPITFTTTGGTFDMVAPTTTTTLMSDAMGKATASLYVGTATAAQSPLSVVIAGADAQATVVEKVVKVTSLAHLATDSSQLNIKSTQIGVSTNVQFVVKDPNGMPVPGVDVSFALAPNSAAGCTLAPPLDRTTTMGVARTTLFSGDSQGTAIITARVTGLSPVNSPAVTIIIGRPSDERFSIDCARKTLGARENPAGSSTPRNDQNTTCTASGIADRNGIKTPYPVAVSWQTEVGTITSSQAMPGEGRSATTFNTAGSLPTATSPLPGEPFNGSDNPRDSFVTIIAVVDGEEQFWDGSGASNGVANGKWDPGEWWVDLPEPFVDSNDNGTWDPGEPFTDTERVDCATGQVVAKNNNWDGPNGCWDAQTKVWRSTHVVYSDALVTRPTPGQFIEFSPPLPTLVSVGSTTVVTFSWYDRFFNRLSSDSAGMTNVLISGTRGTVTLNAPLGGESFGHDLQYLTRRGQLIDAGVFTDEGDCSMLPPDAGNSRCYRTYRFVAWKTAPTSGTLTFQNATAQPNLPDGGPPPPTTATYELRGLNSLQTNPAVFPYSVNFQ